MSDDIVMVGDGQTIQAPPLDQAKKDEPELKILVEGEGEGQQDDQQRLEADERDPDLETGGTEEQKRERRERLTSKQRRERRAFYRQADQAQIEGLRQTVQQLQAQLSGLTGRLQQSDRATIEAQFQQTQRQLQILQAQHAKAIGEGDGIQAVQAMTQYNNLLPVARQLHHALQQPIQPPQVEQGLPPAAVEHAQTFMARHEWWDPNGKDPRSRAVLALDENLKREGWDETSVEYWAELERRMANHPAIGRDVFEGLPPPVEPRNERGQFAPWRGDEGDRSAARQSNYGGDRGDERRGPPVGGVSNAGSRTVTIPKELRESMIAAGTWDNKALREKTIAYWRESQKQNR